MKNNETTRMKLKDVLPNPNNPRTIKGAQLEKLKKSITEFPEMLELRPLVIDENNVVIGGNMRLRALTELGIEDIPVTKVIGLTDDQKKEFVIKDNLNYGDWNWDNISADWDIDDIGEWGLDIPEWVFDQDVEPQIDADELDEALEKYINGKIKQIVCYFDKGEYESMVRKLEYIMEQEKLENHTKVLIYLTEFYAKEKGLK